MKRFTLSTIISLCVSSISVAQTPPNEVVQLRTPTEAAQPPRVVDEELDEAARIMFQRARTAFDAGNYEDALTQFRQAYELSPRPTLLYNIAATLDRLRRDVEAVEALRAYLAAAPDTPDRVEIEARIRVLDGIIQERQDRDNAAAEAEERRRAESEATTAPAAAAAEEERRRNAEPASSSGLHPAIAIGVGGAALVAGGLIIWSGLNAKSRNTDYEIATTADPTPANRLEGQRLFDATRSAERRTNALIGVAAGLGAAAAVLFIFTDFGGGDDEDGVAFRGSASHQGGSMILEGTF